MSGALQDLTRAIQSLARSRGFATTVIATLALAVALQTAMVAVINAYMLRALPYPEADRLYNVIYYRAPATPPARLETVNWGAAADVVEQAIGWDLDAFYLLGGEYPERAMGAWVTPGFVPGFGIRAALGRTLTSSDFEPGQPQVALIAHALWMSRYGGDSSVIGRAFRGYVSDRPADPETFTIVGVLPEHFWHMNLFTQVLTPLRAPANPYIVRLRRDVPATVAARRMEQLVRDAGLDVSPDWRLELRPLQGDYVASARPMLLAAGSAVSVVVLTACVNVALLLILRGMRRRKEIAVRLALGAGMWRIARQLAAEALALVGTATLMGLGVAFLVLRAFGPVIEQQLGRRVPGGPAAIALDWRVLAALVVSGLVVALALSFAPLIDARRASAFLRDRRAGGDRGGRTTRSMLIAVEVAGSVALLAGCGLLLRSVVSLLRVQLGVETAGVVAAPLAIREQSFPEESQRAALYGRLMHAVTGLPQLRSAALSAPTPLESYAPLRIRSADSANTTAVRGSVRLVAGAYFATLDVPISRGRALAEADDRGAAPVVVISETAANRLWGTTDVVGRRVVFAWPPGRDSVVRAREVVGVARDVRQSPMDQELVDVYVPLMQAAGRFASVVLRADGAAHSWLATIRQAVRQVDPEIAVGALQNLDVVARQQLARPKFLVALFGAFGVFAATLGAIGLYAVVSFAVRQREHEIAVRMAVGAEPRRIVAMFLREGTLVVAGGVVVGIAAAVALGRLLRSQLHGVQPSDVTTLAVVSLLLVLVAAAAIWWPARRASRVDPIIALREE